MNIFIVEISSLTDDFKGISYINNQKKIIEKTIPGDVVKVSEDNKLIEIIKKSENRIVPECIHFEQCGGCTLQYIEKEKYLFYKNKIIENIISDLNQDVDALKEPIFIGSFARRKASFKISKHSIGYYKEKTHQIFDLKECLLLDQKITSLLPHLKKLLQKNIFNASECSITIADNGIDVIFCVDSEMSLEAIEKLVMFVEENKLLRVSLNFRNRIAPVYIRDFPHIKLKEKAIKIPESAFLQASKISEVLLIDLVLKYLKNFPKIIDLYCGIGTYSFPLSDYCKVTSFEGSGEMIEAAKSAVSNNNPKFISRNLHQTPLLANELNNFDAAVINPPRNGAERQVIQLANSKIKNIIMISCNHQTFRRDTKILIDSGYRIESANLIDQFYYSKHFEVFAYFVKSK